MAAAAAAAAAVEGNCGDGRELVEDWLYDCWLEGRMLRVGDVAAGGA